jgi:natural product precursor
MENKRKKKKFELLFEQDEKLNLSQMNALKGGTTSPPGCVEVTVGWIVCTGITIGSAQP